MEYKVNFSAYNTVFTVPTEIVDKHIKLAGSAQLKVLLWMLRHASDEYDIKQLSSALGLAPADAVDAMQYWIEQGILIKNGESSAAEPAERIGTKGAERKEEESPKRTEPLSPLPPVSNPTTEDIAKRGEESPEIRYLFSEAQVKLGRTIGYGDQSTLLSLHDHYGLPVEVILMLIEYAASEGKTGTAYIGSVGRNWAENEIDTLEKAEEKISQLKSTHKIWKKFKDLTGISNPKPTAKQEDFLLRWTKEWKFSVDMIYIAYEEMANHTSRISFPYMNKVLENWHANNISTPEQVENEQEKYSKNNDKDKKESKASYDLDEFERMSLYGPIVYKKEGN